jgi:hypothetical protein
MDSTLIAAIIGAISTVVVAIVTAFASEIRELLTGNAQTNSDLVGKWKCTWLLDKELGDYDKQQFEDLVKISKAWGEEISGIGINNEYGDYKFNGRISRSLLVTLHYEGTEEKQFLGGVIIMELNVMRNEMRGYWYEYGRERKIIGGSTVWKKASKKAG